MSKSLHPKSEVSATTIQCEGFHEGLLLPGQEGAKEEMASHWIYQVQILLTILGYKYTRGLFGFLAVGMRRSSFFPNKKIVVTN